MTLPIERTRRVLDAREFLVRLASPYGGGIKGIRSEVREEARRILRHYPTDLDLEQAARAAPDVFAEPGKRD